MLFNYIDINFPKKLWCTYWAAWLYTSSRLPEPRTASMLPLIIKFPCLMIETLSHNFSATSKKYAELFGITDSLGNLVSSYSHGMKQKLALIGAFLHEPKLLVLDEPFVAPNCQWYRKAPHTFLSVLLDVPYRRKTYPPYNSDIEYLKQYWKSRILQKNIRKEKKRLITFPYPLCPEKFMALSGITEPEKQQLSGLLLVLWASILKWG